MAPPGEFRCVVEYVPEKTAGFRGTRVGRRYPLGAASRGSLKVPLAALAGHLGTELFERMEERSDVTGQQRWLLHRGEMAAAVEFGPMRDLATRSHHLHVAR